MIGCVYLGQNFKLAHQSLFFEALVRDLIKVLIKVLIEVLIEVSIKVC
jgi:hypothetical protein